MRSEEYGFNPTGWKIFGVQPCSGKFIIEENQYIHIVTSIVLAAKIKSTVEEVGYYPMENIYLADGFAEDAGELATKWYNPEDVYSIFDNFNLLWMLKTKWDEGDWSEDYWVGKDVSDAIAILSANNIPISDEVKEFMSEPFSLDRVREYYPDTERWGTIDNPKD